MYCQYMCKRRAKFRESKFINELRYVRTDFRRLSVKNPGTLTDTRLAPDVLIFLFLIENQWVVDKMPSVKEI